MEITGKKNSVADSMTVVALKMATVGGKVQNERSVLSISTSVSQMFD